MPGLTDPPPVDDPLDDVINAYLEARQAGREPNRRGLLDAHPALADDLERFFAAHDDMERLTRPLRDVAMAARVDDTALHDGPGRRLPFPVEFGDYVLLEILGEGGMGIVYRAHHRLLNRDVALKQILGGPMARESDVERFRIEAEAVAQLQHPNIVAIHDVGEHEGRHYLTMSLIEGGSLADRLGRFRNDPRAAARLMADVAGAVQHAHERGILHRDLKPSNILVDRDVRPHVTDFGLARRIGSESTLTGSGAILGSPSYMAPEQAGGRTKEITTATDVYGLGAILYALLTGRPPFRGDSVLETMEQVRSNPPEPPRRLNPLVDRDLETIVLKAMARERDARYATAKELADDLLRFLGGEPVHARRPGVFDRTWKWTQRHRALVTAGVLTLLVSVLVLAVSLVQIRIEGQKALDAADLALREKQRALDAARDSRYESLAQRLLRILWTPHEMTWADESGRLIGDLASIRRDDRLKGLVVAAAQGLDLHPDGSVPQGGQSIALEPSGRRLLVSGFTITGFAGTPRGTAVWDLETRATRASTIRDAGPVAFRSDGTPIQLTADASGALRLWDVERDRVLSTFPIPMIGPTGSGREAPPRPIPAALALSLDGRFLAASIAGPGGRSEVFVWGADSARERLRLSGEASCLAFSPDGSLLAGGADAGRIRIWSIRDGVEVRAPWGGETTVLSLAFGRRRGRDFRTEDETAGGAGSWWLAAGDQGGGITVWEAGTGRLRFRGAGGSSRVISVAFSPDGTLLASGGHDDSKLWDVHGGREILRIPHNRDCLGLAFSPDGHRLAAGLLGLRGTLAEGDRTEVRLWSIEDGRGIRSLRGLTATVEKLDVSPDGRSLAALSEDWRVAIWDGATGALRLILEPPEGITADNTALAFSPDGRRFAFSSGQAASLWDLETGRLLERWALPPGLIDTLGFDTSGRLRLFRVETKPGTRAPGRDAPFAEFPRVGRIRELGPSGRMRTLAEIDRFNRHVFCAVAPIDLSYVVVDGLTGDGEGSRRRVASFDTSTGGQLWTIAQPNPRLVGSILLDPSLHVLSVFTGDDDPPTLYRMPQGGPLELPGRPEAARLTARRRVVKDGSGSFSRTLIDILRDDEGPTLLTLGAETFSHPGVGGDSTAFSPDGRSYAWTQRDGTVALTDLKELNRRLTPLGLGWPEEGR